MKHLTLLSFLLITILSSSCNKEEFYLQRLEGKWIYEKAKWQEKTFRRTDILEDYLFFDVYFTEAGEVRFINERDSVYLIGNYKLDDDNDLRIDSEGNPSSTSTFDIVLSYKDTTTKKEYLEVWNGARIGKNKIRFEQELDGKTAYFVLRRQPTD